MSKDKIRNPQMPNQPSNDNDGFEREDLSPAGVFYFMAGLGVVVVVIYFIVFGMYRFLDTYAKTHQPPMSPMVTAPADTRAVSHDDTQAFPQPRLEESERSQLRQFIEDQDRKLATYNWVDKDKGVVQIPIDRAMDLIVQRGLPVRPQGSTGQPLTPAKKQVPKPPVSKATASGN